MPAGRPEDRRSAGPPPEIMARLKAETAQYHALLESLPYFEALTAHRLPLACYVNQLRVLAIVHGVLESELTIAAATDPRAAAVWDDGLRKLPLLEADLAFFKPRIAADAGPPTEAALAMAGKIRLRRMEAAVTLLGYLYVLEGSTLGNNLHRPDITATFRLDGENGCRYYASYRDDVQARWRAFTERMNAALSDAADHGALVAAAHEAFAGLEAVYTALHPLEKSGPAVHVSRINPEAGDHPIPQDEREIRAALHASDRVWAEFPYCARRYGERGKRFSASDTCWLATLPALDADALQRQVDWLCRVLASRGMPTLMMERTLRCLHEELSRAIPDRTTTYEKLRAAANRLAAARRDRIADAALQSLADEFDAAVAAEWRDTYGNMGALLVSAVTDEGNGIHGAVDALRQWLTDAERFTTEWSREVEKTIAAARNRMAA